MANSNLGRGEKSAHAAWQARQIKELIDANATIIKLQRQAREDERKHQANLSELDKRYQEKQAHEAVKTQSMLRDLRNGAVSMRYPTTASKQASGGATSAVKPSASLGDGAETSELPPAIAADIYSEAARADEITEQLGACQQVVIEDRRVCGVANE